MEWMNRGAQGPQTTGQTAGAAPSRRGGKGNFLKGLRLATVALLFSATVLLVALVWFVVLGGNAGEAKYINKKQMQAVFLNGGQVYFGNINDLNGKYLNMKNIYYLRVNQQVQPNQENSQQQNANDISLVKLGCELHGPQDSMVINREQVIFWENLKDDGQVAKAVAEYVKQNPDGQKCDQPAQGSNNTNTNTTTPTTPATNNTTTTPTTPATNNTTNRR